MLQLKVNVRALAEFFYLSGDLRPMANAAQRMQEGIKGHRLRQTGYGPDFETEAALRYTFSLDDCQLTLYGRADALNRRENPPIIEEIKTTRLDPRLIRKDSHPVHWAQGILYAYMLCLMEKAPGAKVRLVYMSLAGDMNLFEEEFSLARLEEEFLRCALPYIAWQKQLESAREKALPTLKKLPFPFDAYRPGQRELAKQSYLALKNHVNLLAQAPTGIGKTAAVLFPALKALGEGHINRIFYLTARNTARMAANQALEKMREGGLWIRSVVISAREKLCPQGAACDPTLCPLAAGYFDRRQEALTQALDMQNLSPQAVLFLSQRHQLCPHELQLDIAENCDVVIGDYNYVFDPRVRLKRFFMGKFDGALLIDEAHNLPARVRDMLSAGIKLSDYKRLQGHLKKLDLPPDWLLRQTSAVVAAFQNLMESYPQPGWSEEAPLELTEGVEMFLDAARPHLGNGGPLGALIDQLYFDGLNFVRVAGEMKGDHRALFQGDERDFTVRLWCMNPAPHIGKTLKKTRGAVLFSATLSPIDHYFAQLGLSQDGGDDYLQLPSPFPTENLCVIQAPVDTSLKGRAQSAPEVAQAIISMCQGKKGNYLACFPSYAYMKLVAPLIAQAAPSLTLMVQSPRMDENQRQAFLDAFQPGRKTSLLGLTVLGGVFAEGVDLPGDRLIGAAIVGVGFPQLSLERAVMAGWLEENGEPGDGMLGAYVYPGLERVLQAAGRVIRTENDVGCVVLLDQRFFQPVYPPLLPPHWQIQEATSIARLEAILKKFWRKK